MCLGVYGEIEVVALQYALEGAIQGVKKSQLPAETKAELKEFYNSFKG